MAQTLTALSKELRELAAALPERVNVVKQKTARAINNSLLANTPVDTGLAVSNWQVQLDNPATEPRAAFVPTAEGFMKGPAGGKAWTHRADTETTRQANIGPAQAAAEQVITKSQPGQVIHITNTLPYIQALDEGHSAQAELFVDKALIDSREIVIGNILTD